METTPGRILPDFFFEDEGSQDKTSSVVPESQPQLTELTLQLPVWKED